MLCREATCFTAASQKEAEWWQPPHGQGHWGPVLQAHTLTPYRDDYLPSRGIWAQVRATAGLKL